MSISLLVSNGQEAGRRYELTQSELLIGRDQSSDICIPDLKISRRHCRISYVSKRYYLEDFDSSNGTYVNNARVTRCLLNSGDRIRIGSAELVFNGVDETIEQSDENYDVVANKGSSASSPDISQAVELNPTGSARIGQQQKNVSYPQLDSETVTVSVANDLAAKYAKSSRSRRPKAYPQSSLLEDNSDNYDRVTDDDQETSRRFVQIGNDLRFLYHASLATSRNNNVEHMLDEILELSFDWIAADRGCVFLQNDSDESYEIKLFKSRTELGDVDFKVSNSIVNYVRRKKVGVLSARAAKDQRWGAQASILRLKVGEVLCVPIEGRDSLLGLIYLDTLVGPDGDEIPRFNEDNLKLLIAMAHQAAVAIENETFYAALLEKERLAAIGETTGVIAHHVKNVLQGINGGAHLVESGLRTEDLGLIDKGWQILSRNQNQISRLVIDMLLLGRPYEPNLETHDLNRAIQQGIETIETQRQNNTSSIVFVPNEDLPTFKFDYSGINTVISHILNLSMMACRNVAQPKINLQIDLQKNNSVIALTDNGEGINVSESKEILDPFGIGDDQKIFGIGLAVSRKIIDGHGGELSISQLPGSGNLFEIRIPIIE